MYRLFRFSKKLFFKVFSTMFLLKIFQFLPSLGVCFEFAEHTILNFMLTMLLLDMISKFLAAKCIKVKIRTL